MALAISGLAPVPAELVETRYRRIVTPILWDSAEGFLVRDPYGNQWIDLSNGIVVANVGHAHPDLVAAIRRQLDAKLLFSYAFSTKIRRELLERLVAIAPAGLDKAILFSSGTEANECALSLMRKHGLRISPGKTGILSIESSYHGRTLSAWQGTSLGALASLLVVIYTGTFTRISYFLYAPIGLALTMILGYLFSLGFPAMGPERLRGLVKGLGPDGIQREPGGS